MKHTRKRICLAASVFLLVGCSSRGVAEDPVAKAFDAPFLPFSSAVGAHTIVCEFEAEAKGEAGKKSDSFTTTVDVDEAGNFRVTRDDGWELLRVGSIAWQRPDGSSKLVRIEAGARPDLLRDSSVVPWRAVLAPFRDRITLTRKGSERLLDARDVDSFEVSADPGGGGAGGPVLIALSGTVLLDAETGFPIASNLHGSWEAPAPSPGLGRVTWTLEKAACGPTKFGDVPALESPEPGPADSTKAAPTATPAAAVSPKAALTTGAKGTKASKPTPKPTKGR